LRDEIDVFEFRLRKLNKVRLALEEVEGEENED
jgi:hypothetical protein